MAGGKPYASTSVYNIVGKFAPNVAYYWNMAQINPMDEFHPAFSNGALEADPYLVSAVVDSEAGEAFEFSDEADRLDQAQRLARELAYLERLYAELGRIAALPLPAAATSGILKRLHGWELQQTNDQGQHFSVLQRTIDLSDVAIDEDRAITDRRSVVRDEQGISITVPQITGDDMRYAVKVQTELITADDRGPVGGYGRRTALHGEFKRSEDTLASPEALFTDREIMVVKLMPNYSRYPDIGAALGTSATSVSRLLTRLRTRTGLESNLDVLVYGIADCVVDLKDVSPDARGALSKGTQQFLANFFSLDEAVRQAERGRNPATAGAYWHRARIKLGVKSRAEVVCHAVKDDLIEMPPDEELRRLARFGYSRFTLLPEA